MRGNESMGSQRQTTFHDSSYMNRQTSPMPPAAPPASKPGMCPPVLVQNSGGFVSGSCDRRCNNDRDCYGPEKCCRSAYLNDSDDTLFNAFMHFSAMAVVTLASVRYRSAWATAVGVENNNMLHLIYSIFLQSHWLLQFQAQTGRLMDFSRIRRDLLQTTFCKRRPVGRE